MSYVSIREFTPYDGKDAVLEPRLRRAISAMTKHGAVSSFYKVIAVIAQEIMRFIIGTKQLVRVHGQ